MEKEIREVSGESLLNVAANILKRMITPGRDVSVDEISFAEKSIREFLLTDGETETILDLLNKISTRLSQIERALTNLGARYDAE